MPAQDSTAGYLVSVGTNPSPPSASTGSTLFVGTNSEFNILTSPGL